MLDPTPTASEAVPPVRIKRLQVDCRLVERHVQLTAPPVDTADLDGRFAVLRRGPAGPSKVVTIAGDGQLMLAERDAASPSGWRSDVGPPAVGVGSRVEPFELGDRLYVLVLTPNGTNRVFARGPDGAWRPDNELGRGIFGANYPMEAGSVLHDAHGNLFVVGFFRATIPGMRNLGFSYLRKGASLWQHRRTDIVRPAAELARPWCVVRASCDDDGGTVSVMALLNPTSPFWWHGEYRFEHGGPNVTRLDPWRRVEATPADLILSIDELNRRDRNRIHVLVQARDGSVSYRVHERKDGTVAHTDRLTGGRGQPGAARKVHIATVDGKLVVFILDESLRLWVSKETGREAILVPGRWSKVGDQLRHVVAAPRVQGGVELFAVTLDHKLERITQDPASGIWFREMIESRAAPTARTIDMAAYVTEISAQGSRGEPVGAGPLVELSATRPTEVFIGGTSYLLEPGHFTPVPTNHFGKVTVASRAERLIAPALKIRVPHLDVPEGLSIRPDVHAHERLARVTTRELLAPIPEGRYAGRVLIAPKYRKDAEAIASSVRATAKLMMKQGDADGDASFANDALAPEWIRTTPYRRGLEIVAGRDLETFQPRPDFENGGSWALTFGGGAAGDGVSFTPLDDDEALALLDAAPVSLWDDLGSAFQHVRNSLDELAKVVVSAFKGVVQFAITIGNEVVSCIARTIQEIGAFIELVFWKVAESVQEAIGMALDWLKEVLGWGDILRTRSVLRGYVTRAATAIDGELRKLPEQIETHFSRVRADAESWFTSIHTQLRGYDSPNLLAKQTPLRTPAQIGSDPGKPLVPDVLQTRHAASAVQCNTVLDLVSSNLRADQLAQLTGADAADALTAEQDDVIQRFFAAIQRLYQAAEPHLTPLIELVKSLHAHPGEYTDAKLSTLIDACKAVCLAMIDVGKEALLILLEAIGALTGKLAELINRKLEIPVLSALYQQLAKADLTVLDLLCLLGAAPVTLLYRAVKLGGETNGRANPPFADDHAVERALTAFPWRGVTGSGAADVTVADDGISNLFLQFAGLNLLPGLLINTAVDNLAFLKALNVPLAGADILFSFFAWANQLAGIIFNVPFPDANRNPPTVAAEWVQWGGSWVPLGADLIGTFLQLSPKKMRVGETPFQLASAAIETAVTVLSGGAVAFYQCWDFVSDPKKNWPELLTALTSVLGLLRPVGGLLIPTMALGTRSTGPFGPIAGAAFAVYLLVAGAGDVVTCAVDVGLSTRSTAGSDDPATATA